MAEPLFEERQHVMVVERVEHVAAGTARPHDPGAAQQPELMRHRRLRELEGPREVLDAHLRARQHVQDADARRVAEDAEDLGQILDVGWLGQPDAWTEAVGEWLVDRRALTNAVSIVPSSSVLVVATETGIPITVQNDLPYPVDVVVDVAPSNGRLIVEDSVEATVEAESRSTVRVPVAAGVGSGEVTLVVSMTSPDGTPVGTSVRVPANVQADWEGVGAAILGAIVVLVFGIGLWRNIRRRRRARADAAGETENGSDDAGAEPSDTDAAEQAPSESDASTETRADAHARAAAAEADATDTHAPDTDTTGPERG